MINLFLLIITLLTSTVSYAVEKPSETSPWKSYMPNAIGYELTYDNVSVDLENRPALKVKPKAQSNDLGEISKLASHFSIKKISDLKTENEIHLSWSPLLSLAFYNFEIDSDAVYFPNTSFQFFRTMAGFGPELKYKNGLGTFSFQVAPAVTYSWVSWSSPVSGGSFARSNFSIGAGFNYIRPVNEKWKIEAFYKLNLEDTKVWQEALSSSQGFQIPVKSVLNKIVGVGITYAF